MLCGGESPYLTVSLGQLLRHGNMSDREITALVQDILLWVIGVVILLGAIKILLSS